MDFNLITPGELEVGQYVTVLGFKPVKKQILLPTGEVREITENDDSPWIKGLPYRVISVHLPLVMLFNICEVPNIPPATFHDTRKVDFLEVDLDYATTYKLAMYPPEKRKEVIDAMMLPEPSAEECKEEQQIFNFDNPEDGEQGPPPLVPSF